jgi:hypothetical protein
MASIKRRTIPNEDTLGNLGGGLIQPTREAAAEPNICTLPIKK